MAAKHSCYFSRSDCQFVVWILSICKSNGSSRVLNQHDIGRSIDPSSFKLKLQWVNLVRKLAVDRQLQQVCHFESGKMIPG